MSFNFRKIYRTIKQFAGEIKERSSKSFITMHTRPLYAADISVVPDMRDITKQCAIVIQGPILQTHNFTLETIRLYKKAFPYTSIILSTWEDESTEDIEKIKKENITIVLNKKPLVPGVSHINFQIHSTAEGVRKAHELDAIHVLKTRTDQRIYNPNTLACFDTAMKVFPLKIEGQQKKRLMVLNMNTFKYRPYSISDMMMYGTIDDMEKYWCVPFSESKNGVGPGHSIIEWVRDRQAEVYLLTNFLESIGYTPMYTLADSWRVYGDHFCVLDKEIADVYWYKYEKHKEYRRLRYDAVFNDQELNFSDWMMLYIGQQTDVPEYIINQQFGKPILQK